MSNIFFQLNRKYPFDVLNLKTITVIGLSVTLMMYIFKPFGFVNYQDEKILPAFGFGLITVLCLILGNFILKRPLYTWSGKHWSILKEFGYTLLVLLLISIANFSYLLLLFDDFILSSQNNSPQIWIKATGVVGLYTVSLGTIPVAIIILLRYNKMLRSDLSRIIRGEEKKKDIVMKKKITFLSQNVTDKELSVFLDDFLFMEAVKNHVHIYFLSNGSVVTKSVRNTLTNLIEQLNEDALFRCHRSFLINLNKIRNANGNSNGYKVTLHGYDSDIPVSRNYTPAFQKTLYKQ